MGNEQAFDLTLKERFMPKVSIEILTQCDPQRAIRAVLLALSVPKSIPVICAIYGNQSQLQNRLSDVSTLPKNLNFVFVTPKSESAYPTNKMRNIAFKASTADLIMYIDVDFVFHPDFWPLFFRDYLPYLDRRSCFCPIPLWDKKKPEELSHISSQDMIRSESINTHINNRWFENPLSKQLFKYHDKWMAKNPAGLLTDMTDRMLFLRKGSHLPEPWGITYRENFLLADQDFRIAGDKVQLVTTMLDTGIKFYSMKDAYIYHLWHPDRRFDGSRDLEKIRSHILWSTRYHRRDYKFLFLVAPGGQLSFVKDWLQALLLNKFPEMSVKEIPCYSRNNTLFSKKQVVSNCLELLSQGHECIYGKAGFSTQYLAFKYKIILVLDGYNHLGQIDASHPYKNLCDFLGDGDKSVVEAAYNLSFFSGLFDQSDVNGTEKMSNLTGLDCCSTEKPIGVSEQSRYGQSYFDQQNVKINTIDFDLYHQARRIFYYD